MKTETIRIQPDKQLDCEKENIFVQETRKEKL